MKSAVVSTKRVDAALTSGTSARVYFSIVQAADYTTATPSWVEDQMRSGGLPYRWIGNKRVIFRRDLDALMEGLPVESGVCDLPAFMDRADKATRKVAA